MKKFIGLLMALIVFLAVITAAVFFLMPTSMKENITGLVSKDDSAFKSGTATIGKVDDSAFEAQSLKLKQKKQEKETEFNQLMDEYELSDYDKKTIRKAIEKDYKEIHLVRDLESVVKSYVSRHKGFSFSD